ncbi:hypothetical protein E2C01_027942 [Portunus trituberculatus]|uniref:Uncharacterized protein n=1 Tax=Portunus trituberculatus TaxID=210409 RepID=A0A5B7EN02_PORTR|nr:hypothetical protein [Portunus trituberculatus]
MLWLSLGKFSVARETECREKIPQQHMHWWEEFCLINWSAKLYLILEVLHAKPVTQWSCSTTSVIHYFLMGMKLK